MGKIVTVEQMREIEQAADAAGHSYDRMMELAGGAVARALLERDEQIGERSVLVLAGSGNNGGDALVAADLLAEAGARVAVYLTKERPEDDPHLSKLRERGLLIAVADEDQRSRVLKLQLGQAEVIVDGILGTGTQLPLRGSAKEVLVAVHGALAQRESAPYVLAVDCPSGVDCDSGEAAPEALPADLTVTLAAAKAGMLRFPAAGLTGELAIADIGIPAKDLAHIPLDLATAAEVAGWLPERPAGAHKGTFGRALVVAGSRKYPGAALLAAEAAYLSGAGLVTCAVPHSIQGMLVPRLPEATWIPLAESAGDFDAEAAGDLTPELGRMDSILIGPGFGLADGTGQFLSRLLDGIEPAQAVVLDADGLKLLAQLDDWPSRLPVETILTPHPGEMNVLTGIPIAEIQADRVATAKEWAAKWGVVLLLKGAHTVVAGPGGAASVLPFASPALARAGTGDVLAGILVGLRAQGVSAYEAAVLGGYLHGRAGLLAAEEAGTSAAVLAGDVSAMISEAIAELELA